MPEMPLIKFLVASDIEVLYRFCTANAALGPF